MGINIAAPIDWEEARLYADVIRMSREFKEGDNANNVTLATLDSNGWPTSDFSFCAWHNTRMHGTYTLTFKGQATVTPAATPKVVMTSLSYDATSNTSTGQFTVPPDIVDVNAFVLGFTNTKRLSTDTSPTGVTEIKLMRPLTPGATKSYPSTALFTDPIKALIAKFSVIRFMDFLATNSNQQKVWSERPLTTWPSFNRYANEKSPTSADRYGWQGIGGAWEHAVRLANETGKDAWINIPVSADDNYILNVARLFAFGSDGVTPYSSAQPNPVYPPLNPSLKLYVEYSNELWHPAGAFRQFYANCQASSDELVTTQGSSPLNWDKRWNNVVYENPLAGFTNPSNAGWDWSMCFRQATKRTVEISNTFRGVFGDAAMMTRVRPVMMTQLTSGGMIFDETKMLLDYYNHMAGTFTTTPTQPAARPPSYYIYASGGSGYYDPKDPNVATADALFLDPGMLPPGYLGGWDGTALVGMRPSVQADVKFTTAMGVKRIAYEGGPNLETGVNVNNYAVTLAAVNDPRMTTTMVNMHNEWSANGGDLFVYFTATGNAQWGFTSDVTNLSTPKLLAIDALNATNRAPVSFGTLVPGSIEGSVPALCSRGWGCSPIASYDYFTADNSRVLWASYIFRSTDAANWTINLSVANPPDVPPVAGSSVAVYVDGVQVDTTKTASGTVSFNAGTVGAGIHGVIVRAVTGSFKLTSVAVTP